MNWTEFALGGVRVEPGARMSAYTTFRLGGACPCLMECATPAVLTALVRKLAGHRSGFILMGGGSNLLVADEGLSLPVIRYWSPTPCIRREGALLEVSGATVLDDLARITVEEGLGGLVYCSGIPGTVAGAVAGNAGAFGQQIGDRIEWVDVLERDGSAQRLSAMDMAFAYRASAIRPGGPAILSVGLRLDEGKESASLRAERESVLALRREKHPDWRATPTAGSFFKNVEPTSSAGRRQAAGWFLEQAGAKGLRVGGARLFEKHANIIVTDGPCTTADVLELSRQMAQAVETVFGLRLEREVRYLGNEPKNRETP